MERSFGRELGLSLEMVLGKAEALRTVEGGEGGEGWWWLRTTRPPSSLLWSFVAMKLPRNVVNAAAVPAL